MRSHHRRGELTSIEVQNRSQPVGSVRKAVSTLEQKPRKSNELFLKLPLIVYEEIERVCLESGSCNLPVIDKMTVDVNCPQQCAALGPVVVLSTEKHQFVSRMRK